MRVKFLKRHLGNEIGSVIDVPEARANYLIRAGVVEEVKEKEAKPKPKATQKKKSKSDK